MKRTMTESDLAALRPWLARSETHIEQFCEAPAQCLAATLNLPAVQAQGGFLPPLWHWLYFLDPTPTSGLMVDGSLRSQALMPPVALPEIMWAGADFFFHAPLRLGQAVRKTSRIADMTLKQGSRGPMVFVTFEHRFEQAGQLALIEFYKVVFLGPAVDTPPAPAPQERPAARGEEWLVNEAVLFRFSALTFNSHRIHYAFTDKSVAPAVLKVNGQPVALNIAKGYVAIARQWKAGDVIDLNLPMPVRRVLANDAVMADRGRVTLQRGPVVYCAEWPDNPGGHVRNLVLPRNAVLKTEFRPELLKGIVRISGNGEALVLDKEGKVHRKAQLITAIPYYAWAHRGPGEMLVWLPETEASGRPLPVRSGQSLWRSQPVIHSLGSRARPRGRIRTP